MTDFGTKLKAAVHEGLIIGLFAGVGSVIGVDQMVGSVVGSTVGSIVPPSLVGPMVVAGTFFGIVTITQLILSYVD